MPVWQSLLPQALLPLTSAAPHCTHKQAAGSLKPLRILTACGNHRAGTDGAK